MIKILNISLGELTKWPEFKEFHEKNRDLIIELNKKGRDLKWLYKQLGGSFHVRKTKPESKKSEQ